MKKNAFGPGDRVAWRCGPLGQLEVGRVTRVVHEDLPLVHLRSGDLMVKGEGEDYAVAVHSSLVWMVE